MSSLITPRCLPPPLTRLLLTILLVVSLTGCEGASQLFLRARDPLGYWLPVTVDLRLDPSVTEAGLDYTDACRQPQTLALGERLRDVLRRELGLVFERVQLAAEPAASSAERPSPSRQADGVVEVALGLKELELLIPRKEAKSYPATVTVGATVSYHDRTGETLYTKKLRTEARGEVETDGQSCEVRGLAALANVAIANLAQGFKKHLGTSMRIQQAAAEAQREKRSAPAGSQAGTSGPVSTPLSFRARLMDENGDQVLRGGELVGLEVEVSNAGSETAKGVVLTIGGSQLVAQRLPKQLPVGDVRPGETKRVAAQGRLPAVAADQEVALVVSLDAASSGTGSVAPKTIVAVARPGLAKGPETSPVDVDRIPEGIVGTERRTAVGISIGVGVFQDTEVPGTKFAVRDAEVMARYMEWLAGIPATAIKLMTDEHALKDDLAEAIEDWLPEQAKPGSEVFIFFSGRALVEPGTGAVSLLPYDARPGSLTRAFSLRRLHAALARLPIQRVVLWLDITLTPDPEAVPYRGKAPVWRPLPSALAPGRLIQMVGISGVQAAHQHESGRHGLFSYFLLRGLGGEADGDGNGLVEVGELCDYVREQVLRTARSEYKTEQRPICVPEIAPHARGVTLARVK